MRSKCRMVLVALVGVLVVGVVASASASAALPEFQQGGKGLTKVVKFTAKGGMNIFYSKSGAVWKCGASTVTGETHGVNEVANVVIKFTGCRIAVGAGTTCTGPGAKTEEMVTAPLSGRIGYLSKASQKVGLLLEPSKGGLIAECVTKPYSYIFQLRGAVIGWLSPSNEETTELNLSFKRGAVEYVQEWSHFEGEEATHKLESSLITTTFYETAIETNFAITSGEAMEVKA